jgi:hypothetical protein
MAKKWTAVQFDLGKQLAGKAKLERVELPKSMTIQIDIELDDAVYNDLSKNPTYLAKMQSKAKGLADDAVADMLKAITVAETKASKFDKKQAEIFTKDLQSALKTRLERAGDTMADECDKLFEDYKKGQSDLKKFRIKSAAKIGLTAFVVTGGAVASVLSAGALSPLGIVGIVRGGVTIGQEIVKLALDADKSAKIINGELKVLKKLMLDKEGNARGAKERGGKEIALNVASKIIGIESPSLKNCESHIGIHKVKIAEAEKQSKKLSEKIYEAMDTQSAWSKEFDKAKKSLPSDKVGKVKTKLEASEKSLDTMIQSTIKINEAISRAEARQEAYEEAINALKEGIPGWLKFVDVAVGMAIDVATAVVDSSTAIEKGLNSAIAVENVVVSELIDAA